MKAFLTILLVFSFAISICFSGTGQTGTGGSGGTGSSGTGSGGNGTGGSNGTGTGSSGSNSSKGSNSSNGTTSNSSSTTVSNSTVSGVIPAPNTTVFVNVTNGSSPYWSYTNAPCVNATNSTFQTIPSKSNPTNTINAAVPDNVVALEQYPNFPGTIVLSKPTDTDMTFSVVPNVFLDYYQVVVLDLVNKYSDKLTNLNVNEATEVTVFNLSPNTKYSYYLQFSVAGVLMKSPPHTFQTSRISGSSYKFAVIADSHLFTPDHCYPPRYAQTLLNLKSDSPDFIITLGDDFRTSNVPQPATFDDIKWLFVGHRPYHNIFAQDAPVFNVNGNHEWEEGFMLDSTSNNIPLWVTANRLEFYANPRPNHYYSGNSKTEPFVPDGGLLENYYSWTWGDALYVVLDDYWYSAVDSSTWGCSFGYNQFQWLKNVLATSTAKFKFIFHHHLSCTCRGGAEYANAFEWGGFSNAKNPQWQFDQYRPGWGNQSIHQMMVQYKVNAMFQGHDHLYAIQEVDGVKYITVPMPAYDYTVWAQGTNNNADAFVKNLYVDPKYGVGGPFGPAGHLTVEVTPSVVNISYYRVAIDGDPWTNKFLNHSFLIYPK